jgi:cardiolipin synthase
MLACDDRVAFVGGFNIAPEYEGDGVSCGWCDIGLRLEGELVHELAVSFDEMFERAEFKHKRFARLRRPTENTAVTTPKEQLLFSGPGRGSSPIKTFLRKDFAKGNKVQVVAAYFLPTWRLRRELARVAQRGGTVQLLLAGKSDVRISQLAGRSLYPRFLRRGVQIFEYQPQVLHAKLIIVDDIVYVGSANLDQRSLNINYELVVRFQDPEVAQQAREVFDQIRSHSQEITLDSWRGAKGLWRHLKESWAYFLLVRIDPYIARRQWRSLPD